MPGPSTETSIGRSPKRREDVRFVRGAATFSTDVAAEGMLYAAFVRSSEAHGTILGVDALRADALAGVLASYTGPRLGSLRIPAPHPMAQGH